MKVDSFAFPLVGIGAFLRLFSPNERGKALGMALAGFGLLFMGITALQENFAGYAQHINVEALLAGRPFPALWALGIGFVLTLLTQSSSAAIAIILTAVASGVAGLEVAAAAVIGANVGTTSTALIASLGATANAKRLAWAHVAFKVLTACVAILLLPLIPVLLPDSWENSQNLTLVLAVFHSGFNLLGVLLIWPVEPALSRWLLSLYAGPAGKSLGDTHLDANVATVPDLALQALRVELRELLSRAGELRLPGNTAKDQEALQELRSRLDRLNDFMVQASKSNLTRQLGGLLNLALTVSHHLRYACDTLEEVAEAHAAIAQSPIAASLALQDWFAKVDRFTADIQGIENDATDVNAQQLAELMTSYRHSKAQVLGEAVHPGPDLRAIDYALQAASQSRRFAEQLLQATQAYRDIVQRLDISSTASGETKASLSESGVALKEQAIDDSSLAQ